MFSAGCLVLGVWCRVLGAGCWMRGVWYGVLDEALIFLPQMTQIFTDALFIVRLKPTKI